VNCADQSFNILRANRAAGTQRLILKEMRVARARPAACESSQMVNSQDEKAKFGWGSRGDSFPARSDSFMASFGRF
jgi:hypothetical protein